MPTDGKKFEIKVVGLEEIVTTAKNHPQAQKLQMSLKPGDTKC